MGDLTFSTGVIYFMAYSVLGWLVETVFCSVAAKKPVNRGFLSGPYCPIYGFGALLAIFSGWPLRQNVLLVFLVSVTVGTLLEYATSWLMEVLFQARWWDYSGKRFQLQGRVCLQNSLLFGLLGVVVVYGIHPEVNHLALLLSPGSQRVLASVIVAWLGMDLLRTLAALTGLQERLETMKKILEELEQYQKDYGWYEKGSQGNVQRLKEICLSGQGGEHAETILEHIEKLEVRQGSGFRMLEAFPEMHAKSLPEEMEALREHWRTQKQLRKKNRREKLTEMFAPVREAARDTVKSLSLMDLFWLFLAGSVIGYLVETGYCLIANGVLESRQGMLYGPFSQLYGFAALVGTFLLVPLAAKGNTWLFVGSAVIGGLFEAASSLFQEIAFGSVSWQYSHQPLSFFGGRTSLLFMFFWGLLGSVFVRMIYPRLIGMIKKIHKRSGKALSLLVVVAITANLTVSVAALDRWSSRHHNEPATNSLQQWLDENFPDEKMEEIYPSMRFMEGEDIL